MSATRKSRAVYAMYAQDAEDDRRICPQCHQPQTKDYCQNSGCANRGLRQVAADRVVITDDDREICPVCGELPKQGPLACKRCERAMEDDRMNREMYG